MIAKSLHEKIRHLVGLLQRHAGRGWYAPLIGLLSAIDTVVIVIPTDGILISSSMLKPRRWFLFAFSIAFGSTLGALALAALVGLQGHDWVLSAYPGIDESALWLWTERVFHSYGLYLVFAIALTPLAQQPAVILAGLAETPLAELAVALFAGRLIKYILLAYIGSHAPRLLSKLWGLDSDLKDAGVNLKR